LPVVLIFLPLCHYQTTVILWMGVVKLFVFSHF
jgi:hypothetical protein